MAHEGKVVCARDAGGPAAHDGDALARGVGDLGTVAALHVLACVAFEGEDVERVVHDAPRRQCISHGCSQTRPQTMGIGLSLRIRRTASVKRPASTSEMYPGMSTFAGQPATHGTRSFCPKPHEPVRIWCSKSSRNPRHGGERHGPRLVPDGAVARQVDGLRRLLDMVQGELVGAIGQDVLEQVERTRSPMRQGVHLPQLCVAHMLTRAAVNSTGRGRASAPRGAGPTRHAGRT